MHEIINFMHEIQMMMHEIITFMHEILGTILQSLCTEMESQRKICHGSRVENNIKEQHEHQTNPRGKLGSPGTL